ncbi:MAG: hypothetical protein C0510_00390 [Erythrobacter sp.]|nr:hypothetical protein [Erythrobacter sp.]
MAFAVCLLIGWNEPAASQDGGSAGGDNGNCIVAQAPTDSPPFVVLADCQGHILNLGPATYFQVFQNQALKATVVDLHDGNRRRIVLLRSPDGSAPAIDVIGGTVTLDDGLVPIPLTDLDIDFSGFAADGIVRLAPPNGQEASRMLPAISVRKDVASGRIREGLRAAGE